jgi:hypothetical protein
MPVKAHGDKIVPGCGLGHSISYLLHGDTVNSFHAHWLGIPALTGIAHRIYSLIKQRLFPLFGPAKILIHR